MRKEEGGGGWVGDGVMVAVVHVCVWGGEGRRWGSECAGRGGALDRQHPAHRRGPAGPPADRGVGR